MNEQEIFEAASKIKNKDERGAFLRTACQGNQDQHIRLEAFIRSDSDDEPLPCPLPPSGSHAIDDESMS